jgi:hypothetical protein
MGYKERSNMVFNLEKFYAEHPEIEEARASQEMHRKELAAQLGVPPSWGLEQIYQVDIERSLLSWATGLHREQRLETDPDSEQLFKLLWDQDVNRREIPRRY